MHSSGNNGFVKYTILDETGPDGVLLFGCETHPGKKLTSYMLETHMRTKHEERKFTVSIPSPAPELDPIKNAGVNVKEVIENGRQNVPEHRNARKRERYDRPVPGPRQSG